MSGDSDVKRENAVNGPVQDGGPAAAGAALQETLVAGSLGALDEQARETLRTLRRCGDRLALAETGLALETLCDALDQCFTAVETLIDRAEEIRHDAVMAERFKGAEVSKGEEEGDALDGLDTAILHLSLGHEGLRVGRHLVGLGRGDLLEVEEAVTGGAGDGGQESAGRDSAGACTR
ncbi:hypothetical protein [Actinomadura monticuli]|uniref:Uncharacterized protein n=1 Tax=Actinomadura monticuli TaxID=3097367 RepID=A0ABV4QBE2_9ACTN